jgi:hypothetical protein
VNVLAISVADLRILDAAFEGKIGTAFAAIVRAGGTPEMRAIRNQPDLQAPSSWTIVVCGAAINRHFNADNSFVTLGLAARIYLHDFVDELRVDLANRAGNVGLSESPQDHLTWLRGKPGEPS